MEGVTAGDFLMGGVLSAGSKYLVEGAFDSLSRPGVGALGKSNYEALFRGTAGPNVFRTSMKSISGTVAGGMFKSEVKMASELTQKTPGAAVYGQNMSAVFLTPPSSTSNQKGTSTYSSGSKSSSSSSTAFSKATETVKQTVAKVSNNVSSAVKTVTSKVSTAVSKAVSAVKSFFSGGKKK
jgi:gas vesicle protein